MTDEQRPEYAGGATYNPDPPQATAGEAGELGPGGVGDPGQGGGSAEEAEAARQFVNERAQQQAAGEPAPEPPVATTPPADITPEQPQQQPQPASPFTKPHEAEDGTGTGSVADADG